MLHALLLLGTALAQDSVGLDGTPSTDPGEAPLPQQVDALTLELARGLTCPDCEGAAVSDSSHGSAAAFYSKIKELVGAGYSKDQINGFFVERYGTDVLVSVATPAPEPEPPAKAKAEKPKKTSSLPKVRPDGPDFVWRVQGSFVSSSFRATQTVDDPNLYANTSFAQARGVGFSGQAEAWYKQFGAELGGRWAGYRLNIGEDSYREANGWWTVGGRYRQPVLDFLAIDGLVGLARTDVGVIGYNEDRTAADVENRSLTGARIGVAGVAELGPTEFRAQLSEVFGGAPVLTELELQGAFWLESIDIAGTHPAVHLGWTSAWRHWSKDLGTQVKGRDGQGMFRIGLGLHY